jgi:hypothetical protein
MAEIKIKANPDFTASAENLNNAEPTVIAYAKWLESKNMLERANLEIEGKIPTELITARDAAQKAVDASYKNLQDTVKTSGGMQDVEAGRYALQQRRISKTYAVEPFKMYFGEFTPAVLIEALDIKALEDLVNRGRINEISLKEHGVLTEEVKLAFIIR